MRVSFLAPCPAFHFADILDLKDVGPEQPSTWILRLARIITEIGLELHIVTQSDKIRKSQAFRLGGIEYHFLKRPRRFNVHTLFQFDRLRLLKKINEIEPDIIHAHGTEDAYAYTAVTSNYPCIVSIQGIISYLSQLENAPRRYGLIKYFDRFTIRKGKFFIAKTPFASQFVKSLNPGATVFDIENPVKTEYFSRAPSFDSSKILFVGSLTAEKGI